MSCVDLLTVHRELLVSRLKSIQCLLDNLAACGFFCEEDVDIVQQTVTRTEKVGRADTSRVLEAFTDRYRAEFLLFNSVLPPLGGTGFHLLELFKVEEISKKIIML